MRVVFALMFILPRTAHAQRACEDAVVAPPSGGWEAPLDTRVTIHARDVSLRDAIDGLAARSGVRLAYSVDYLPADRRVCVVAERQPLGALLATVLRGADVQVLVVAGRVVLSPGVVTTRLALGPHGVSVLERVVVTGDAGETPRRPLAMGLEVIDGATLRRQALPSLAEMLDASVPGVWSWSQPSSSLVSRYGGIRGASSFGSSAPKIYIDGVEVANPLLVTQVPPDAVDRIEVIRGPQGAALYGSDAISGVINVFTRHDGASTAAPMLQLRSVAGAAGSAYAPGLVPTQEQRLTLRVGTSARTGGLAVTYGRTGALVPSTDSRQVGATGDARIVADQRSFTLSARIFDETAGTGPNPLIAVHNMSAAADATREGAAVDAIQSVRQYTVSATATVATEGRWTHTLVAGIDGYRQTNVAEASRLIPSPLQSALHASRGNGDRVTLRENSVARIGNDDGLRGTLILGVEQSVLREATTTREPWPNDPSYDPAVDRLAETWNHDTGVLSQVSAIWNDAIFLTGGLRVERSDAFSGSTRYPLLPMSGVAVVRHVGAAALTWRAAYGKGIRSPQTSARGASLGRADSPAYPGRASNEGLIAMLPALDPEVQSGYEWGAGLSLGKALSLQVTRFDQRATGLIQNVSVAIDTPFRNGAFERRVRYQLQNVGEITNTGWEFQGSTTHGPFSLSSAFSSVDSRVRTLARGYLGDLRRGDRMLAVPARTASVTATYAARSWFATVGVTRAMDWINYDRLSLANWYLAQRSNAAREPTGARLRTYWRQYDGETHLRLSASRDLTRGLSLLVIGENLLGGQLGEPDNATIRAGRTVTAGLRASF